LFDGNGFEYARHVQTLLVKGQVTGHCFNLSAQPFGRACDPARHEGVFS